MPRHRQSRQPKGEKSASAADAGVRSEANGTSIRQCSKRRHDGRLKSNTLHQDLQSAFKNMAANTHGGHGARTGLGGSSHGRDNGKPCNGSTVNSTISNTTTTAAPNNNTNANNFFGLFSVKAPLGIQATPSRHAQRANAMASKSAARAKQAVAKERENQRLKLLQATVALDFDALDNLSWMPKIKKSDSGLCALPAIL